MYYHLKSIYRFCLGKIHEFKLILNMVITNKQQYKNYVFKEKKVIYSELKECGIYHIRPTAILSWKISYDCIYLSGKLLFENAIKNVFVKVSRKSLQDCYRNEYVVNQYIRKNSQYISEHTPPILAHYHIGEHYYTIMENVQLKKVYLSETLIDEVQKIVDNYTKCGIIHTDFWWDNMGSLNGKIMFIDYGTSLCCESNNVRIRNGKSYNKLLYATRAAFELIPDPDFYYDDVAYLGLTDKIDRRNINFIVGKGDTYFAKLGKKIYEYQLVKAVEEQMPLLRKVREFEWEN